jgi:hypothetical protein
MGYASLGIPMAMVMFQSMGERMNKAFSVIIQKLKKLIGCTRTEASEFDLILVKIAQSMRFFSTKKIVLADFTNGTARFKKCKQWFEYQYLLLLRDIWWSEF